jgi:hypothetical protein
MDSRISIFKNLDERFYPYLEKALNRLPSDVQEIILDDKSVEIIGDESFLKANGLYRKLDNQVSAIIYLNALYLKSSEDDIVHTIAHEIAHHFAGKGKSGLWEKEAEELLVKWGFLDGPEKIEYYRAIGESWGFNVGYDWANKQDEDDLLDDFEQYFDEWNEGRISGERLEQLHYLIDPSSLLDQASPAEKVTNGAANKDDSFIDNGTLDKGVIWGIMCRVKEIIQRKTKSSNMDNGRAELIDTLRTIDNNLTKLYDLPGFTPDLWEESHRLGIPQLAEGVEQLLRKALDSVQQN